MWNSGQVQQRQAVIQEQPLCTAAYKDNCSRHPIPHFRHSFAHSSSRDIPAVLAVSVVAYRSAAEKQCLLCIKREEYTYLILPRQAYFQTLSLYDHPYYQMTLD